MRPPYSPFVVRLFIFLVGILSVERGFFYFADSHFLPEKKIHTALAAGEGCFLYVGDSRMASLSVNQLESPLRKKGDNSCVADLSLGGVEIAGQAVAVREYLSHGKKPRAVILGFTGASLYKGTDVGGPFAKEDYLVPEAILGNELITVLWAKPADVFLHYPGFPYRHFDPALRFSLMQVTSFGIFSSMLWRYAQALQLKLFHFAEPRRSAGWTEGIAEAEQRAEIVNGQLALFDDFESQPLKTNHRWFTELEKLLSARGIPLILVHLPIREAFIEPLRRSAKGANYWRWLEKEAAAKGHLLWDFSRLPEIHEDQFSDLIHLNEQGADGLGKALAERLPNLGLRSLSVAH